MSEPRDTSYHRRQTAQRMQDPEFRSAYEAARAEMREPTTQAGRDLLESLRDYYPQPSFGWGAVETAVVRIEAEARAAALAEPRRLVDAQAEDEGLWFIAETAAEAYLQQELRRLHAAVEGDALAETPEADA